MSKEIIRILNNIDILFARLDRDGDANTITANIKHILALEGELVQATVNKHVMINTIDPAMLAERTLHGLVTAVTDYYFTVTTEGGLYVDVPFNYIMDMTVVIKKRLGPSLRSTRGLKGIAAWKAMMINEMQCKDRLTFQNFLGYPEMVPDARTVWLFRERLAQTGKEKEFWELFNSQLKGLDLKVKDGESKDVVFMKVGEKEVEASKGNTHLQDSTMLESDPGAPIVSDIIRRKENEAKKESEKSKDESKSSSGKSAPKTTSISISYDELKKSKERGDDAHTRRSADGTWTKKRNESFFGYKLHTKVEARTGLIEDYQVTTASLHDNQIDLSRPGEPIDDSP